MKKVQEFIEFLAEGLEHRFKYSAARSYRSLAKSIASFSSSKELLFPMLTTEWLLSYEHHLQSKGCLPNSSSSYLRMFRSICHQAERQELMSDTDELFSPLFLGYEETRKRALTLKQLRTLADADLSGSLSMAMTRDFFILSYYLRGIPFIDLAHLKHTDIRNNVLCYRRSKTGHKLTVVLEPWMWMIIRRYMTKSTDSLYLFRIIHSPGSINEERRQYESALRLYNKRLSKLSEMLNLGVKLTSYVARHTWATLAYSEDVSVSKISEALSHASETVTYHYLRSFTPDQLAEVNLRMAALINKEAGLQWSNVAEKQRGSGRNNDPFLNRKQNVIIGKINIFE